MIAGLVMGLAVVFGMLLSCGSDDSDDHSGVENNGKRVVEITRSGVEYGYVQVYSLTYDPQGRIVKYVEEYNGEPCGEAVYTYTENLITFKSFFGEKITSSYECSVENGRVVKKTIYPTSNSDSDVRYTYYDYDNDGYLHTITSTSPYKKDNCIWGYGNLLKIGNDSFEYGDLTWRNIPFGFNLLSSEFDTFLQISGYYGKMPKNLPVKRINSNGTTTYVYDVINGLIKSITYVGKSCSDAYTYEWN